MKSYRALDNGAQDAGPPELTPTELLTVTAIAYLQPATRGELSRLVGKEVSRDIIGRLKGLDLIAAGPRAPEPGAPFAYVTTKSSWKFLASPACVICPTSKGSRTPACCNGPRTKSI
jgi:chromosome segregation and condensation protein ScpB